MRGLIDDESGGNYLDIHRIAQQVLVRLCVNHGLREGPYSATIARIRTKKEPRPCSRGSRQLDPLAMRRCISGRKLADSPNASPLPRANSATS